MKATFDVLNQMQADGIIGSYAIGGAVGATFYLEPVATLDVDVFVLLQPVPGSVLVSLTPLYEYLTACGHRIEGEYIVIGDWPVQFLPASDPLEEEAILQAIATHLDGTRVLVIGAEHLVAFALALGRAKDFSRVLQFIEAGVLDVTKLDAVLARHGLLAKWEAFGQKFL